MKDLRLGLYKELKEVSWKAMRQDTRKGHKLERRYVNQGKRTPQQIVCRMNPIISVCTSFYLHFLNWQAKM